MRRLFSLFAYGLVLVMLCTVCQAQTIPNASFEQWTGGNPDGWQTSNSPPTWTNITQSTSAHAGASAVEGTVVSLMGTGIPPSILAGADGNGFPIASRPDALHGWYKFTSVGGDGFNVSVVFSNNSGGVGAGMIADATPASVYREFIVNILWPTGETPDTVEMVIATFPYTGVYHVGTVFTVDDLAWGSASDVKEIGETPLSFALEQNYPNPFNPATNIEFQVPQRSHVSLRVFDVLGREVADLVSEELSPGKYRATLDGATLPSGAYFYHLQAGVFSATKRLMLVR